MVTPPKRYLEGFRIASMDTHEEYGDDDCDFLKKWVRVSAEIVTWTERLSTNPEYDLVARTEVETCGKTDTENSHCGAIESYRIPFPYNVQVRKNILRLIISQPAFWRN